MMKGKLLRMVAFLMLLLIGANQCFAALPQAKTLEEKIKAQVSKALGNQKTVTVKLKNGVAIKGLVDEVSTTDFKLRRSDTPAVQTIAYADVAAVQEPSQFVNALKNLGKFAFGGTALGFGGVKTLIGVAAFFGMMMLLIAANLD